MDKWWCVCQLLLYSRNPIGICFLLFVGTHSTVAQSESHGFVSRNLFTIETECVLFVRESSWSCKWSWSTTFMQKQAIELPIIEIVCLRVCFYSHHTILHCNLHMCANSIQPEHVDKRPMNEIFILFVNEFAFGVVKALPLMIIKTCFCALNFN